MSGSIAQFQSRDDEENRLLRNANSEADQAGGDADPEDRCFPKRI
jgi:hypothetical protein